MTQNNDYGKIAESIVKEILEEKYGKKYVKYIGNKSNISGDFLVKDRKKERIIEVKGQGTDDQGQKNDSFDTVARYINLSQAEWDKLSDKKKRVKNFKKNLKCGLFID